jgi:putative hydrolase of HD superfamily
MEIILRTIETKDLDQYYELNKPTQKFHAYNGPYFKKDTEGELKAKIQVLRSDLLEGKFPTQKKLIVDKGNGRVIGEVSWYWKSEVTKWKEVGIVIFDEDYWGLGIGYKALKLWVDQVFSTYPDIVRLGLTTWSGNQRMMKLAEKLGFRCEAVYRRARTVNGLYYDSISYGVLREEWDSNVFYKGSSKSL